MRLRMTFAAALVWALGSGAVTAQTPAAKAPQEPATRQIQGFNVVLVLAETTPASAPIPLGDLPPGAQRAIQDMREFLPFKSYRVLDSQWTSCCARDSARVSGMLRGLVAVPGKDNTLNLHHRPYGFHVEVSPGNRGMAVRFELMLESGDGHPVQGHDPVAAGQQVLDTLEARQRELAERGLAPRHPERAKVTKDAAEVQRQLDQMKAELERAQRNGPGRRATIDSSFSMDPGETVVVGTSRLGGDKALIALVTAVRRGKG